MDKMDKEVNAVLERIAESVADRLFVNGFGQPARRLVLELENFKDGGGWCKDSVRDQIVAELARLKPIRKRREPLKIFISRYGRPQ